MSSPETTKPRPGGKLDLNSAEAEADPREEASNLDDASNSEMNLTNKENTGDQVATMTSGLKTRKHLWKESSLHPILAEYGLSDDRKKDVEKPRKEKKQKAVKKKQFSEDYDDEKQKSKRERYLQQYEDIQRMRTLYYKVYLEQLKEKVQAQRARIRKKSEMFENKLKAQEEKEADDGHHLKRRLPRHTLEHNDEFVRHVPKSAHYKIIALQDKLKSKGQLRTQEDIDRFWSEVTDPDKLKNYLILYKPLPTESSDASTKAPGSVVALSQSEHIPHPPTQVPTVPSEPVPEATVALHKMDTEFRPMTKIQESMESSRPQTREMTARPERDREHAVDSKKLDPATVAKLAAAELEKKCPQMDLPEMACFFMELSDDPQDPNEILSRIAAERRQKERRLFVKRLRRMYHLSTANCATAQRILSMHQHNGYSKLEDPDIADLIAIDEITRDLNRTMGEVTAEPSLPEIQRPWLHYVEKTRRKSIIPIQEEPYTESRTSSATSSISQQSQHFTASKQKNDGRNVHFTQSSKRSPVPPLPLSLTSVSSKVVEAKCLSTMWNNYLHAGKSKFANVEA